MKFFYQVSLRVVYFFIPFFGWFIPKLKRWYDGQKIDYPTIDDSKPIIWLHTPSYGEFEQGTPVLKALKEKFPNHNVLVSFFSPSGYEAKRNHPLIDYAVYLPFDFPNRVNTFLDHFNPKVALFVKYDFWMNLLNETHERKIPIIYFSSIFRPTQYFFRFPNSWFTRQLKKVDYFFVQNRTSQDLLEAYSFTGVYTIGDTRIDQVIENADSTFENKVIENWLSKNDLPILILGSTWNNDIELWKAFILKNQYRCIIAPHEIDENNLAFIEKQMSGTSRLSSQNPNSKHLIIDKLGLLKYMYRFATITYIGGGFGKGIHNTLEPSVYGKPVLFGPKFDKFQEAKDLIELGIGFNIENEAQLSAIIQKLTPEKRENIKSEANKYFEEKAGATDFIMKTIKEYL